MYIINIDVAINKMGINELRDLIFEKNYKRIASMKRLKIWNLLLLATKLIEKISDTPNAKEHYQLFIRNKNKKISKIIGNNYLSTENFWKPKQNIQKRRINYPVLSSLYSDTKKWKFLHKKM